MPNYTQMIALNQQRWDSAVFKPSMIPQAAKVAKRLAAPKAKRVYQSIESRTGVPWFVIAVIHEREASQDWKANIGQGDPWNKRTVNVPAGRGPFKSFEDAADDALLNCGPYAGRWKDWSAGGALTLLTLYNGLKYDRAGIASPYTWSGTNHYKIGKVTRDHGPIEQVVDTQLGCAIMISEMMKLDDSISFTGDQPQGIVALEDDVINPDEFPDPGQIVTAINESLSPKASDNEPPEPAGAAEPLTTMMSAKSMMKSKIGWAQAILAFFGIGSVGSQVDKSNLDKVISFVTSPGFILLCMLVLIGLTIFWRWKDYGRGAAR